MGSFPDKPRAPRVPPKPPPARPKPTEDDNGKEAPLSEEQLADRTTLIRVLLVAMGVGAYAGIALLTRELPGGALPYVFPLSKVPSLAIWLLVLVLALMWSRRKPRIVALLCVMTLLAGLSVLGAGIAHRRDPAAWSQEFRLKFGE